MRLFQVLPILSLLFGTHASSLDLRQLDAHPLDARDFSDVCAILDPTLADNPSLYDALNESREPVGQSPFSTISSVSSGIIMLIGSCLCLSQVSEVLENNIILAAMIPSPDTLTDFVRRKITVPLNLPDRISI